MILKLFSGKTKTIASAAAIVAFMTFVSRIVGLLRDRILAGEFGAGDTLDIYYAAFRVPDFVYTLIVVGALSASFIPFFAEKLISTKRKQAAWDFTNNIVNIIAVCFFVLAALGIIFAGPLATLIAPGFSAVKQEAVAGFMQVMFISNFLLAISAVFGAALQGLKRFFVYSLAPVLYNLGIIVGVVWFVDWFGAIGLAWGVVFGALLHLLVQLTGVLLAGYKYQWSCCWRDSDTQKLGKIMVPRALGLGIWQVNFIIMTVIASTLAAGSVAIFQFAFNLEYFAIGIFGVSFAVAAFPNLSEYAAAGNTKRFIAAFSTTARQMLFFIVPASVMFLILRAQIVRVVLGSGVFGWEDTIATADVLALFTLSFFAQALIFLLVRGFFAYKDTMTPLYVGIVSAIVNTLAALLFSREFGVAGLGLAYSLWAVVHMALLWVMLRNRVGSLGEASIVKSVYVISIAGVAAAVVMQFVKTQLGLLLELETFWSVLTQGFVSGAVGLVVYGLVCWALRSPELKELVEGLKIRFLRKAAVESTITEIGGGTE